MQKKIDYYFKNYGVFVPDENGNQRFYSLVENDYIRYSDQVSFWNDLTSLITDGG